MFKKNPLIEEKLAKTAMMGAMLKTRAEAAATIARETAPVKTGDYQRGITSEAGLEPEVGMMIGRLNALDFKSHWIEFGTAKGFPARATLRLACERAGLMVRSTR